MCRPFSSVVPRETRIICPSPVGHARAGSTARFFALLHRVSMHDLSRLVFLLSLIVRHGMPVVLFVVLLGGFLPPCAMVSCVREFRERKSSPSVTPLSDGGL